MKVLVFVNVEGSFEKKEDFNTFKEDVEQKVKKVFGEEAAAIITNCQAVAVNPVVNHHDRCV